MIRFFNFLNHLNTSKTLLLIFSLFLCYSFILDISYILTPFLFGLIGAYVFSNTVNKLENFKVPRSFSALLIIIFVFGSLFFFIFNLIPFLQKELMIIYKNTKNISNDFVKNFDFIEFNDQNIFNIQSIKNYVFNQLDTIIKMSTGIAFNLFLKSFQIVSSITFLLLTPIIMFYALKDFDTIKQYVKNKIPIAWQSKAIYRCEKIDTNLAIYAKAQLKVGFILMFFYAICLKLAGIKGAFFIAIITGFLIFVPYVGIFSSFLFCLLIQLAQNPDKQSIFYVIAIFLSAQIIESNYLTPKIVGEKIGVHPIILLLSLLLSAHYFGFVGIVLALPLATVIKSLVEK